MPNIPETLVAFIAAASLGATWAACPPEFGPRSVVDRFRQVEPLVLLTVPGYGFRDRYIPRVAEIEAIRAELPTVRHVVGVPYGAAALPDDVMPWDELLADGPAALEFEPVPFDHPLYILFSSGTTGLPKAIIHSHGGQLVEHFKSRGLQWDMGPQSRLMWFATTAWMMWNALVSSLLVRSSVVMLDGDPIWPDLMAQWRLVEETRPTNLGVSPVYLMACRKAGLLPGRELDLSALRILHTAGSPLPAEGYRWVYEHLDQRVLFDNGTGGTDICSGFAEACLATPVYEGEISAPCLGVDLKAFDPDGNPLVGELGEMVVTSPMPSMPVGFCGDPDGSRLRDAYFDRYPGVWRQGDWIRFTEHGSCVVTGRSDATLNRGGVRLGTGEFYMVLEGMPEVGDSLVIHLEDPEGGAGELLLFVVIADDAPLEESLQHRIAATLRSQLSPRHVPDRIIQVDAIPRTLTGKKLETPVKRILRGQRPDAVASRDALLDPTALDAFVALAQTRTHAAV
jgi:acetoacetyl-CoA synthetase